MIHFEKWLESFGGIGGLGILLAGVGFAFAQVKSGGNKAKDDLITTLKESLVVEKAKADSLSADISTLTQSHQKQLNELTEKLGKLQGLYEAAEKRNEEMMKILQGRSPEQEKSMKDMHDFAEQITKYVSESANTLKEVQNFMQKLNGKAKTNELRNEKIDHDTEAGSGNVMRKEGEVK